MRNIMMIKIRKAVTGDEKILAELNSFVQEFHVSHNPSYFKRTDPAQVDFWFCDLLEKPTVHIWIAEQDERAVGYATVILHERSANPFCLARKWIEIDQIGVIKEYRCSGIGRLLIEQAIRFAREQSIKDIELTSWAFNDEAHKAFEKIGFRPRLIRFGMKVKSMTGNQTS